MHDALTLYRERGAAALWDRTLGYMDYSMEQTMELQRRLLLDRLQTLPSSALGRRIAGDRPITSVDEFRERVPFTSYADYEEMLGQRNEAALEHRPLTWTRTSGRTANHPKWIPLGPRQMDQMNWHSVSFYILSAASERGDVRLKPNARLLNMTAPNPYTSGTCVEESSASQWPIRLFPSPESADMEFTERMAMAFRTAVTEGIDYVGGLPSVLAGIGETFGQRRAPGSILDRLKNPRAFMRMGRAAMRAKAAGRGMLPKDAFEPMGVIVGGGDSSLFRSRIKETWGRYPLEMFVSTEALLVACQAWDCTSLTFVPTLNFLEFIPDDESVGNPQDTGTPVRTVLLDELETGKNYEMVVTNFLDGVMVRYRTGDILRIVAAENRAVGVQLPQAISYGRRSDTVDLAGFVKLTEQTVWRALEEADVPYVEWTARKEVHDSAPVLHLRIEPRPGSPVTSEQAYERVNAALRRLDPSWGDLEMMAALRPLRLTYLPEGSFDRYTEAKRLAGADLGHLKPLHMNATDAAIAELTAGAPPEPVRLR
jgi:hypothetical protein